MIKETLLVKSSTDSSLGFDFERNVLYIQEYKTHKKRRLYSYSNTFFLSYIFLGMIGVIGIILDNFFKFPILLSLIIATLVGVSLGKTVVYLTITRSLSEKTYLKINKKLVEKAVQNKKNLWVLRIACWVIMSIFIIFALMLIDKSNMTGGDFIAVILGIFGLTYIENSLHPSKGIKAIKILNEQLKEGIFND